LNSQETLNIENVKIIRKISDKSGRFSIFGTITNNGNNSQKYIEVVYKIYQKREGKLEVIESNKTFVENLFLQSGETTTFVRELHHYPTVLMISSLDSVESGLIPLDICYGDSVEERELCQHLNPRLIKELQEVYK